LKREHWASLTYKADSGFGERIFVNMPYRANYAATSRLSMWISPAIGHEDRPGAWYFHTRSGGLPLPDQDAAELLAAVFALLAGHGLDAEAMSFRQLAMTAQRPQHFVPDHFRDAARKHIKRQHGLELELEKERSHRRQK